MTNQESKIKKSSRACRGIKNGKIISSFIASLLMVSLALGIHATVFADTETKGGNEEPVQILEDIIGKSGLSKGERIHQRASTEPGASIITSLIFQGLDFLKYLLGGVAVLYIIISGIKLIAAGKKIDETSEKEKENLKYIIYGLILVIIAEQLVTKVFFGDYGECLASKSNAQDCAKLGGSLIKGLYSFMLAIIGSLAVFILVISGFRLVTSYGNEEDIAKQKKRIAMAVVGLLVAGLGEFAIKGIVFPESGAKGIDLAAAQKLVANLTNFISAFIGTAAFAMLFYGGILYVVSFGNEEKTQKAKKIMIAAVIGIIIALAAFGTIRTVTTFTGREVNLPRTLPGIK